MMPDDYTFEDGFMPDGSIVIFPTDTVFGIACRLYDNDALNRISKLKNNHPFNYAVLCDTLVSINDLAIIDERAKKLMMAFWPGKLTIILKSSKPHFEKTGDKKIAVRIPNHNSALRLIKKNGPLVTTSLSSEDQDLLMDLSKIKATFTDKVDYIYEEYNNFYLNLGSTTIDLSEDTIQYIRIGSITEDQIKAVVENNNFDI
ncbi:L-threonylcarbamoyladenylate synthase [Acholeplasma vituli]|uniref:L-threonylcarbamoyladenylate synthase n=1 Tax=Paracholeplasma vituli TaxID=69473 RepID=A0ABT2PX83_9MOLU|nr:L-threonylcarbamoyladenylate synthase [Paracholeplasma vituli]MCU0104342.1 L-threonylcarbamoyladenylate synthase [Paracholeplasma vituli]